MWEIHGKRTADEAEIMEYFNLKYPPMVKSLLDTDLYKCSMGQTYHHQFGNLKTTWDFKARNVGKDSKHPEKYDKDDLTEIENQIKAYCALRFNVGELDYLGKKCPWIKKDYLNFLKFWHPCFEDFTFIEDEKFGVEKISKVKGLIEFKNVSFAYPNEDNIINDFNIKLEPNKKIAIVGKSGQGKSTLFNLITRIFDAKEGLITLDNINMKDLTEEELRKHISIIRQEPFIFNRTILENFKIIDKNIELEEIRKYTKMAYLDDYIMSLPDKYDTVLGEGGVNLSGGQKQRLSIARTLAKNSEVILFDEATSALDNSSQDYIKKTIDNLIKDHTVVIVAHRLSTIMDADIIYLVDKGKVVDSGTHNELLKTNKTYKKLYETESLNS